jgi:hypothetical protein
MDWVAILQASILVAVGAAATIATTFLNNAFARKKLNDEWARDDRLQSEQRARDAESERHRLGKSRAEGLLTSCDALFAHFDSQRAEIDHLGDRAYSVPYGAAEQIRRDARLIPSRELRELILSGIQVVSGPWVQAAAVELDGVGVQRRILAGVIGALTSFLNQEPIDTSIASSIDATREQQREHAEYHFSWQK